MCREKNALSASHRTAAAADLAGAGGPADGGPGLRGGAAYAAIIVSLATARVSNAVNRIVVDAVRDAIDSGQVDYNVLIHLEKDETGRVAALESNMAAFNRLHIPDRRRNSPAAVGGIHQRAVHPRGNPHRLHPAGG